MHDSRCELDRPRHWSGPPVGVCWCAERAEGYEHWVFGPGAATCEASQIGADEVPPNELGGAA